MAQVEQVPGVASVEEARLEVQVIYLDSAWAVGDDFDDLYVVRGSGPNHHPSMQSVDVIKVVSEQNINLTSEDVEGSAIGTGASSRCDRPAST